MNRIKFATFNIGGGVPCLEKQECQGNRFDAVEYMTKLIRDNGLDIVCFQEMLTEYGHFPSMGREIGEKSGLDYYSEWTLSESHVVVGRKMGTAIASRFPITGSRIFRLENPDITYQLPSGGIYRSHEKGFLIVGLQTDMGEICCVTGQCIPFHSFGRKAAEFRHIYSALEKKLLELAEENRHVMIGADFNISRDELALLMPKLLQRYSGLPDGWIATRPNGRGDDYILYKREKGDAEFRLIKTCFDHYGCMGIFGEKYFANDKETEKMEWEDRDEEMAIGQGKRKNHVYVLHLSDLHFSKTPTNDRDSKISVKIDSNSGKIGRFKNYMAKLSIKPDYVVVSGDVTVRGERAGFEEFNRVIKELIKKGKLPTVDKFIVAPGNHDVTASDSVEDRNRWVNFKEIIGNVYTTPWIVDGGSDYYTMMTWVDAAFSGRGFIQGGNMINPETGEHINVPFLLDKERKILFYAFNSAFPCQIKIDNQEVRDIIGRHKKYGENDKEFSALVQEMEKRMKIDPARIVEEEIELFIYCMNKLEHMLKEEYADYIKIAILHHHITSIACDEEIKEFELLTNAGEFKKILADYGFHMVLHGHKHWNEVYRDTAISSRDSLQGKLEGRSLLGISGGTICGEPCKGRNAGFYLLDFSMDKKAVKAYYHEVLSYERDNVKGGGEYYFDEEGRETGFGEESRKSVFGEGGRKSVFGEAYGEHCPEEADKSSGIGKMGKKYKLKELFSRMEQVLMENIRYRAEGENKSFGWGRLLIMVKPDRISMMATAYGLIIADMLKIHSISYMTRKEDIVNTLWNFRLEGEGGFKASSQTGQASIEATVCALRAFYCAGDMVKFELTLKDLEMLMEKEGLSEESSITTLTLALDVLCECRPTHEKIGELKDIIIQKAFLGKDGCPLYWAEPGTGNEDGAAICTALAVVSLLNYAKSSNGWKQMAAYLHSCGEWLLRAEWNNWEETIPHKTGGPLTYYHYTAFWGIIALLRLGYNSDEKRIRDEIGEILEKEENGIWAWNNGLDYPIWTIYNAILTMNEYAFSEVEI